MPLDQNTTQYIPTGQHFSAFILLEHNVLWQGGFWLAVAKSISAPKSIIQEQSGGVQFLILFFALFPIKKLSQPFFF